MAKKKSKGFTSKYLKDEWGCLRTPLRVIMLDYVDQTPNLPEHIKPQVKQNLVDHINFIGQYLGTIELLWRREKGAGTPEDKAIKKIMKSIKEKTC